MFARALSFALLALALAACSPPMSSAPGMDQAVAAGLAPPRHPLASGLYRFTGFTEADGRVQSYAEALAQDEGETPPLPEYFVLQWHAGSQSYALFARKAQLYDLDGADLVLALSDEDDTFYLPLRLGAEPGRASVLVYGCTDLPESFRSAEGIGAECKVSAGATVLDGLRQADLAAMGRLHFERVSPLPDLLP